MLPVENVQEYPRPPALEPVGYSVKIVFGGKVIVDTDAAIRVLETHHAPTYYIPPDAVEAVMRSAPGRSFCEWKGQAEYFDVIVDEHVAPRAAWTYVRPTRNFADLAGYFAFYAAQMDQCFVAETLVTPQPGDFYGGWHTPNLGGQIKGAPGTEHW